MILTFVDHFAPSNDSNKLSVVAISTSKLDTATLLIPMNHAYVATVNNIAHKPQPMHLFLFISIFLSIIFILIKDTTITKNIEIGKKQYRVQAEFAKTKKDYVIADDNREGIRVSTKQGWFLLRLSVHDPVMPMNFESNETGGINTMKQELKSFFGGFDKLEIPKDF